MRKPTLAYDSIPAPYAPRRSGERTTAMDTNSGVLDERPRILRAIPHVLLWLLTVLSSLQFSTKMTGTTPSSYNVCSSSQLAKAEAKYMKDYVCCGDHFKSLHELCRHHEVSHGASGDRP
ncbi:hypothetical protein BST61_g9709 [Cercospora zeina]